MNAPLAKKSDYVMLTYFLVLVIFGLLVLSSAGVSVGLERFGDAYFFIKRQLILGVLPGIVLFLITAKIDYHVWKKYALPIFIAGIILLVLPFIPGIGSSHNTGARSWIVFQGHSFQPAEAVKLTIIIYISALLSSMGSRLHSFSNGFLYVLGLGLIPIMLVALQPDIGTTFILCIILLSLLFIGNARLNHIALIVILAIVAFGIMISSASYRTDRLMTFLHPELDPQGLGYHINQAYLAIGSGGWLGLGLGHSRQKFQYLPEVHADSIFAVAAEELGFIIILGVMALFILIAIRGMRIAKQSDPFGRILVGGIITWFMIQTLLNIGAMVGLLPLTGVPLPFVSHGGSALVIGMIGMGIVMNVSKNSK